MATEDSYTRSPNDGTPALKQLAMTGPSVTADPGCLPVRGDLAHIKLAGRCFVPHYAVPMPHTILDGAVLRTFGRDEAEAIRDLPVGETFNVLDIAGQWAWGQLGEDGQVGYVALSQIETVK
ncbi:SH3 domain-containing protein [Novosphingobium sp. BL-8A]|uniref:SH3 domain-containing protein n=1 Tax=Novosphingobium sp. BL-8A TaxID=3127639 RepID=UPI003757A2F1